VAQFFNSINRAKDLKVKHTDIMISILGKAIHRYSLLHHPFFNTSADKYLKWLPFATVFFLDVFGVKTKSGWKKQVLIAAATEAIRFTIADSLKKLTHEHRPAPRTGNRSFPSGHTSSSFAGAEFLHLELKDSSPVLSYVGYVGAMATATIRLLKNKHWLRDVVAGAVVGILSAKLAHFIISKRANRRAKTNIHNAEPEASEEPTIMETSERSRYL